MHGSITQQEEKQMSKRKNKKYDRNTVISVSNYYVGKDTTMVVTAEVKNVPRGSVHYVLEKCKYYSKGLYDEVRQQAEKNKHHRYRNK